MILRKHQISSKVSVINVPKVLLKHAYHPLMDQLVTVASNTAHIDISGLNCIADISVQNGVHVTRRYSDCMLKLNNMFQELSTSLANVCNAYITASYAVAGFEDYCMHHSSPSTTIAQGNIGSINLTVTFLRGNSSTTTSKPCFITHVNSIRELITTVVPMIENRISSVTYDTSYIDILKTNSKQILTSSLEFAKSISMCNGYSLTSSVFTHSNIKLPVYISGAYSLTSSPD
jgi:hypothetical protein